MKSMTFKYLIVNIACFVILIFFGNMAAVAEEIAEGKISKISFLAQNNMLTNFIIELEHQPKKWYAISPDDAFNFGLFSKHPNEKLIAKAHIETGVDLLFIKKDRRVLQTIPKNIHYDQNRIDEKFRNQKFEWEYSRIGRKVQIKYIKTANEEFYRVIALKWLDLASPPSNKTPIWEK